MSRVITGVILLPYSHLIISVIRALHIFDSSHICLSIFFSQFFDSKSHYCHVSPKSCGSSHPIVPIFTTRRIHSSSQLLGQHCSILYPHNPTLACFLQHGCASISPPTPPRTIHSTPHSTHVFRSNWKNCDLKALSVFTPSIPFHLSRLLSDLPRVFNSKFNSIWTHTLDETVTYDAFFASPSPTQPVPLSPNHLGMRFFVRRKTHRGYNCQPGGLA